MLAKMPRQVSSRHCGEILRPTAGLRMTVPEIFLHIGFSFTRSPDGPITRFFASSIIPLLP
jgi:hypothetical protein